MTPQSSHPQVEMNYSVTDIITHPRKKVQMAEYMDLVLVESPQACRRWLCRAPWLTHLEVGASVRCEFSNKQEFSGEVIATTDIRKDDENLNFILECVNQKGKGLPKVISRLEVIDLKYRDEEDENRED